MGVAGMTAVVYGSVSGPDRSLILQEGKRAAGQPSFGVAMQQARHDLSAILWSKGDLHGELRELQRRVEGHAPISSRELLVYQLKASRFHLQVELLSKAAESLLGALRKFQTQG